MQARELLVTGQLASPPHTLGTTGAAGPDRKPFLFVLDADFPGSGAADRAPEFRVVEGWPAGEPDEAGGVLIPPEGVHLSAGGAGLDDFLPVLVLRTVRANEQDIARVV